MRMLTGICLLSCMLLPTLSLAASEQDTEKATQEIRQRATEFSTAWKKGDAKLISTFYTPDGTMVTGAGRFFNGREEIEQALTSVFDESLKGSSFTWTVEKVKLVKPDVAVVDYDAEIKGADAAGEPMKFHIVSVLIKDGGKWLTQTTRGIVYAQQ
ncbi:MAG TPA: SgcJ/EcaC family oxidoreductase [Tepidisphaeraceae bacterium]